MTLHLKGAAFIHTKHGNMDLILSNLTHANQNRDMLLNALCHGF